MVEESIRHKWVFEIKVPLKTLLGSDRDSLMEHIFIILFVRWTDIEITYWNWKSYRQPNRSCVPPWSSRSWYYIHFRKRASGTFSKILVGKDWVFNCLWNRSILWHWYVTICLKSVNSKEAATKTNRIKFYLACLIISGVNVTLG